MAYDGDNILLQHRPRDLRLTPRRAHGREVFTRYRLFHAIPCTPPRGVAGRSRGASKATNLSCSCGGGSRRSPGRC